MRIQAGIKLLGEIEGYGEPIRDSDRFDAVLKFYRNEGDPLVFDTVLQKPIPHIVERDGNCLLYTSPHLFAHSMHEVCGIDRDSVIKLEVFLTRILPEKSR